MTGEWLFSAAAFGEEAQRDDEQYFQTFPKEIAWIKKQGKDAAFLSSLRHEILPRYIDDCLETVDWGDATRSSASAPRPSSRMSPLWLLPAVSKSAFH